MYTIKKAKKGTVCACSKPAVLVATRTKEDEQPLCVSCAHIWKEDCHADARECREMISKAKIAIQVAKGDIHGQEENIREVKRELSAICKILREHKKNGG